MKINLLAITFLVLSSIAHGSTVIEASQIELAGNCRLPIKKCLDCAQRSAAADGALLAANHSTANAQAGRKYNSACDLAKTNYYKETNNVNATFSILQAYDEGGMSAQETPDGRTCPQAGWIGYVINHCVLGVQ